MIKKYLSIFAQKKCLGCQCVWHFFCLHCLESLYEYEDFCYICKKKSDTFSLHTSCYSENMPQNIIVLSRYRQQYVKKLIRQTKFYRRYNLYYEFLNREWTALKSINPSLSILVPVPSDFLRKLKRHGNHTHVLAKALSQKLEIPLDLTILQKRKHAAQQSRLSKKERLQLWENVFHAYYNRKYENYTLYIIDDVVSSGVTLSKCVVALKKVWYTHIKAICLASD